MPRVENLGANIDAWSKESHEGSTTHDVCTSCHRKLEKNPHEFDRQLTPLTLDEPQGDLGWGGEVAHPSYAEGFQDYHCKACRRKLAEKDD